jgi:DNA-binding NtrC family response regulator
MSPKILIIDDEITIRRIIESNLVKSGFDVTTCDSATAMRQELASNEFQLIVLDILLPDGDGIEIIKEIHQDSPHLPIIMITAQSSVEVAVEAMKAGAYDFCTKPIDINRLNVSVKNALEIYRLKQQIASFSKVSRTNFCGILGSSPAMQVVYQMIENVAPTNASVMITGESGTGKELIARAIHELSPRKNKELIEVNCAAIPKDLLESELFGHERHAFTGANKQFKGRCEQADDSTLFLDEISEMNFDLQAKLLRFLQEQSFYRVGGSEKIQVDTRVISATNRDPLGAVKASILREDLYYRLNVVNIQLPALRDRGSDIMMLAEHFLTVYSHNNNKVFESISPLTKEILSSYSWNGNIRELQNVIQQSVILHNGTELQPEMLPESIRNESGVSVFIPEMEDDETDDVVFNGVQDNTIIPLDVLEKRAIDNALRLMKGHVSKAASKLNVSQTTLYRKVREYDLPLKEYK